MILLQPACEHGYDAEAPYTGASFDLLTGTWLSDGNHIHKKQTTVKEKSIRATNIYLRLVAAGQRLIAVIRHNEGGTNKDLIKFTDQINSLCDKWDR